MEYASRVVAASADQDRLSCRETSSGLVVILADGAGGIPGGREAAEAVVEKVKEDLRSPRECADELARLDQELQSSRACGETTAIVLVIDGERFHGASIGGSGVLVLHRDGIYEATKHQRRKPLLGSGRARLVGFGPFDFRCPVVVGSDGLLKYAPRSVFSSLRAIASIEEALDELVDSVRMDSGGLQDDVSVALLAPEKDEGI